MVLTALVFCEYITWSSLLFSFSDQCNFDRTVKLSPISEDDGEAKFECKGPVKIKPTDAPVFTGDDCRTPVSSLSELVPGAKLIGDTAGVYTLKVASLPTDTQKLCFQCVYPDPRKGKSKENTAACSVTVEIKGAAPDPSKTTTASTTASAAKGIAVGWIICLGLALASAASV